MFKRFFGKGKDDPPPEPEVDPREEQFFEEKSGFISSILGEEAGMVMHAIIPYAVGGGLDLYYYPHKFTGTAVATKELTAHTGGAAANDYYPQYELVMATREPFDLENAQNLDHPFGQAHDNINRVLNIMARYAEQARLNPFDTAELPQEMPDVGGKCFIFDGLSNPEEPGPGSMGLMLVIEIFRSEMLLAREFGGEALLEMLDAAGFYPYSDLDREPVG